MSKCTECPVYAEVLESSHGSAIALFLLHKAGLRRGFHHYPGFQNEKDVEQSQSYVSEDITVHCCKPLGFGGHLSLLHHFVETDHSSDDTGICIPAFWCQTNIPLPLMWELKVSYSAAYCPLPPKWLQARQTQNI